MKKQKSKKKNTIKKLLGKLHLWLGLSVGFIVFIVSITGAIYAFQEEITNALRKDAIYNSETQIQEKSTLPIVELEKKVNEFTQEKYPIHWANIPINKQQNYVFYYYERNPDGWNYFNEYIIYKSVYINPFTGEIEGVFDEKNNFFNIIKFIHWSFLLKADWGTYIVGIPTLIFVIMLITGIILWWPKNKKARKQRFWFQWKNVKSWRRKNYDLHSILGFYASFIALLAAITGLFYAFVFVQQLMYFTFSGGETTYPDFAEFKTQTSIEQRTEHRLDKIAAKVEELYPTAYGYSVDLGHEHLDEHEHPNFSVFVKQLSYSYHKNHSVIFDENTGKLLHVHSHSDKNFGEKVIAANYDMHVGAILGIWGKILAFISSLICASLPITGFLVWWGRKNKKKKTKSQVI